MRGFFCYERSKVDRKWIPVVYFHERPVKSIEFNRERSPESCHEFKMDDKDSFSAEDMKILVDLFPPPENQMETNVQENET